MFRAVLNKVGNQCKRIASPFKMEKLKAGTAVTTNSNVRYKLKNSWYVPKKDLENSVVTTPPSFMDRLLTMDSTFKNYAIFNGIKVFNIVQRVAYAGGASYFISLYIVDGGLNDLLNVNVLRDLLTQVDFNQSINVLYNTCEQQVADYIKSFKCEMARVILPNNVPPIDLLGDNSDILCFDPVLNRLYVDLWDTYNDIRSDAFPKPLSTELVNPNKQFQYDGQQFPVKEYAFGFLFLTLTLHIVVWFLTSSVATPEVIGINEELLWY
jgi:hypothetical protein